VDEGVGDVSSVGDPSFIDPLGEPVDEGVGDVSSVGDPSFIDPLGEPVDEGVGESVSYISVERVRRVRSTSDGAHDDDDDDHENCDDDVEDEDDDDDDEADRSLDSNMSASASASVASRAGATTAGEGGRRVPGPLAGEHPHADEALVHGRQRRSHDSNSLYSRSSENSMFR